jgi:hypothetical protein
MHLGPTAGRLPHRYHADRMMRAVMRVSVQASISATQMSANSLKYVTSVSMALPLCHDGVDLGHGSIGLGHQIA